MYVVYCVDRPCDNIVDDPHTGGRRRGGIHRMQCMDDHNAYQVATSSPDHPCFIHKIAVVPMLAEDGITMIGSCFMLNASRPECERFLQSDPLFTSQVWDSVSISRFSAADAIKQQPTCEDGDQRSSLMISSSRAASTSAGQSLVYHSRSA